MHRSSLIVVGLLLAGCAQEAPAALPPAPTEPIHAPLEFAADNVTSRSHTTFLLPISPDAPVAGFHVEVPAEATFPMSDGSSFSYLHLVLEMVADKAPDGALVLLFDGPDLRAVVPMEAARGTTWLTAALPTDISGPANFGPMALRMSGEGPEELGVVVAARGLTGPAALKVHFPSDREGMLEEAAASPGQVLDAYGNGTAYEVHERYELILGLVAPLGLLGVELEVGSPRVDERQSTFVMPHGGVRDASLEASCSLGGWGYAATLYYAGEGGGAWAHEVAAGDSNASDDGLMVYGDGYGFVASALVFGLPVGMATGDGAGPATARIDVQTVETGDLHVADVFVVCLDRSMQHLLGAPAPSSAMVFEGLLGLEGAGRLHIGDVLVAHDALIAN